MCPPRIVRLYMRWRLRDRLPLRVRSCVDVAEITARHAAFRVVDVDRQVRGMRRLPGKLRIQRRHAAQRFRAPRIATASGSRVRLLVYLEVNTKLEAPATFLAREGLRCVHRRSRAR